MGSKDCEYKFLDFLEELFLSQKIIEPTYQLEVGRMGNLFDLVIIDSTKGLLI